MEKRPEEIRKQFNSILDHHLERLVRGEVDTYLEIHDIAKRMHLHPTHLSITIKETTGKSPCDICNEKKFKHCKITPKKSGAYNCLYC